MELKNKSLIELEYMYCERFKCAIPREVMPPCIQEENLRFALIKCLSKGNSDILGMLGIEGGSCRA